MSSFGSPAASPSLPGSSLFSPFRWPRRLASPRGFSAAGLALQLVGQLLLDDDVGIDALGLDRAVRRRVVARRRQPDRAVGAERDDRLHRALAERARADDGRALVVLQGAGDDLGGRGRAAVDQHDDLLAVGLVAGMGLRALRLLVVAALGQHDGAALEEVVGDGDRLIEQAARVVAQVDDVALELVADRLLQASIALTRLACVCSLKVVTLM